MNDSYIFLADGFEEIEALATVDILRRAGMKVHMVSIKNEKSVTGAHGLVVEAEMLIDDADFSSYDWLILPGGLPGAKYLSENAKLSALLKDAAAKNGNIAAICASPAMVLGPLGIIDGRDVTGYPGTENLVPAAKWNSKYAVVDENIVTGQGPAAVFRFAMAIVARSKGQQVADQVAAGMLL